MKKLLLCLLFICFCATGFAQRDDDLIGKIALSVYIPKDEPLSTKASKQLESKLKQIATRYGCASEALNDRFVITAHMMVLDAATTGSVPPMEALTVSFTVYVGDSETNTLFSSWSTEVTGVGTNREESLLSAVKKISINNRELSDAIEVGKAKIVDYYNSVGPDLIAEAEGLARGGNYDAAVYTLSGIPNVCRVYGRAQELIGQYVFTALETANLKRVAEARAAWAADPNEYGASRVDNILGNLEQPSPKVLAEARALTTEIATRLKAVADRQFAFEKQQAKWEHDLEVQREKDATKLALQANANATRVQVATVKAAASVARAYYNSRPRVVHHVHWW